MGATLEMHQGLVRAGTVPKVGSQARAAREVTLGFPRKGALLVGAPRVARAETTASSLAARLAQGGPRARADSSA